MDGPVPLACRARVPDRLRGRPPGHPAARVLALVRRLDANDGHDGALPFSGWELMLSSVVFRMLVMRLGPFVLRRRAIVGQTAAVTALFIVAMAAPRHQPPLAAGAG